MLTINYHLFNSIIKTDTQVIKQQQLPCWDCLNRLNPFDFYSRSAETPFLLSVVTDSSEAATELKGQGFNLNFRQNPCS